MTQRQWRKMTGHSAVYIRPALDGKIQHTLVSGDGKVVGHFPDGEHTAIPQSLAPAGQAVIPTCPAR